MPTHRSIPVISLALLVPSMAQAATIGLVTQGALLQQPTSQYYHAGYGLAVDAANDKQNVVGRLSYVERPEFRSQGFADKDYGYFAQIGTKVTKAPKHGLFAYFGGGQMIGYIKNDETARQYKLSGFSASAEYQAELGNFTVGFGHQTFAGFVDMAQLNAFVAWPYNLFLVNLGYRW